MKKSSDKLPWTLGISPHRFKCILFHFPSENAILLYFSVLEVQIKKGTLFSSYMITYHPTSIKDIVLSDIVVFLTGGYDASCGCEKTQLYFSLIFQLLHKGEKSDSESEKTQLKMLIFGSHRRQCGLSVNKWMRPTHGTAMPPCLLASHTFPHFAPPCTLYNM